jgi:hypothetical protein
MWQARCLLEETANPFKFMKQTLRWILVLVVACAICSLLAYRNAYRSAYHNGQVSMIHESLKVMVNGVEVHTLMSDQYNALQGFLEAAGQTNAIEMFRQYRCAFGADQASSHLGETLAILRYLREGHENQAIYDLEQHLSRYANLMCNFYGGIYPSNRERIKLESLERTRDYFAKFPHPEWGSSTEKAMNEVLRLASEKPKK